TLLGVLLPVSNNFERDREIFLKIMTMDDEGLFLRKEKNLTQKDLYELLDNKNRDLYMELSDKGKPVYKKGITTTDKETLQRLAFRSLSYDDKLKYCTRPEHIENLPQTSWDEINAYLETNADSFPSLIEELGVKRFGHRPKIGDVFSGGGSIHFEAARLGTDVFASDLNPVASLLTWASLHIAGARDKEVEEIKKLQAKCYTYIDNQIS